MQRYFVEVVNFPHATITGEDARHIQRVMRMKEKQQLIVVSQQQAYSAEITQLDEQSVEVLIGEKLERSVELPVHVTIACGLPKGDKLDLVIQKATELGMAGFIPFEAERSIVKWEPKKWAKKQERFEKIAKEAAEQSHRTVIPTIADIHTLKNLVEKAKGFDTILICDEEEAKKSDRIRFADHIKNVYHNKTILVVFGPEGGLTRSEVEHLVEIGGKAVTLGPRILRAETAPLYALAAISYEFE
ncbi:16S rRNA (uracil(1498)-N(3))-methyltransferase [Chryseomicrobium sp. FSL W7-1435]|uniref:16S rRNA (uracil(1498)-N(3))-methyltransferase n=1 Tax=Chryseomicrobium sp. FSL W7-1435 TaxID=2921704 RepID=UPI00315A91E9